MDATVQKWSRNSRWSRDPVIDRAGAPAVIYPTARDIEIFKLLVRVSLSAERLHSRLCRRQRKGSSRRLNLLCRKPNLYLARPHQQRQNADANYRPLIYQLDERGSRVLRERGLSFLPKSYHHNFAHELMVAQITASIELGTRENTDIRLITWPENSGARDERQSPPASPRARPPSAFPIPCAARRVRTTSLPTLDRSAWSAPSTARAAICSFPGSRRTAPANRSTPAIPPAPRSPRSSPPTWRLPSKACTARISAFPISLSRSSPPPRRGYAR